MTRTSHGLVIGKFYPLHRGHLALIRFAADRSERLTVLLMATRLESISMERRRRWLESETADLAGIRILAIPCDAPVDYGSGAAWHAHTALIRAALDADAAPEVSAVFGSEPYLDELAERLGAAAIGYDVDRSQHDVSGTAIREDLVSRWTDAAPAARQDLAVRVVVVGAESTGTTTLAEDLAAHYRASGFPQLEAVAEYGREYTYMLHAATARELGREPSLDELVWRTEHFAHVAEVQTARENDAALACPLVIADTDAWATQLWERRYVGIRSAGAAAVNATTLPRHDVYLVTDHEGVAFDQDGWRDGEHIRAAMTGWFITGLTQRGASWVLLRGDRRDRLQFAVTLVDALWAQGSRLDSPPWADLTRATRVSP